TRVVNTPVQKIDTARITHLQESAHGKRMRSVVDNFTTDDGIAYARVEEIARREEIAVPIVKSASLPTSIVPRDDYSNAANAASITSAPVCRARTSAASPTSTISPSRTAMAWCFCGLCDDPT